MLSGELAHLRSGMDRYFEDTCTITRCDNSSDGEGGTLKTYEAPSPDYENVPCTQYLDRAVDLVIGDKVHRVQRWKFDLPAETDVRSQDHIIAKGRTFNVIGSNLDQTIAVCTSVICEEITKP